MTIFTLHTGTWDSHHLVALFSTKEKAEAYVKKFKITDAPHIEEMELDLFDDIVKSKKTPCLATCKKKDKITIHYYGIHETYKEGSVHFSYGVMYYYFSAEDKKKALKIAEAMRKKHINNDWNV